MKQSKITKHITKKKKKEKKTACVKYLRYNKYLTT